MPMLGDILASARASGAQFEAWLAASDPALAGEVANAAAREGLGVAAFARVAIHDFTRLASEEDWATLMSGLRDNEDPGTICLLGMVDWRLKAAACAAHSHAHPMPKPKEPDMPEESKDTAADAPLNPSLKARTDRIYDTTRRTPAPFDSASAKEGEGEGWPWIWVAVTIVGIGLAIYFLV